MKSALRTICIYRTILLVHQSPGKVFLQDGKTIPLYCVTSGHSLDYVYQWKRGSLSLHGNSPVLWVNKVGSYICNITHSVDNTQTASNVITVEGKFPCM